MHFAVCGLHLRNFPLNHQLTDLGGTFIREARTTSNYAMYALSSPGKPTKPGLILHPTGKSTASLLVEIWDIPEAAVGPLLNFVSSPLGFGTVFLDGGEQVYGFTCEGWAADQETALAMGLQSVDITSYGGWAKYAEALAKE